MNKTEAEIADDQIVVWGPYGRTRDRKTDRAMKVVARRIIHNLCDEDAVGDLWDLYPEIGENDWRDVLDEVAILARAFRVAPDDYDAAYALLEARAEQVSA